MISGSKAQLVCFIKNCESIAHPKTIYVIPLSTAFNESDTGLGEPGTGTPRDTNKEELREYTVSLIIEKTSTNSKRRKKKKLYKQSTKDINMIFLYYTCNDINRAEILNDYVEFTKHFCYLGTFVLIIQSKIRL